ncbi:hypothetical protein BY458DRAFT_544368 [Sporodiniella umbellata]|nr:hypothetical protein BY458DRAFT_544368 [Sporodiniella umbellata]
MDLQHMQQAMSLRALAREQTVCHYTYGYLDCSVENKTPVYLPQAKHKAYHNFCRRQLPFSSGLWQEVKKKQSTCCAETESASYMILTMAGGLLIRESSCEAGFINENTLVAMSNILRLKASNTFLSPLEPFHRSKQKRRKTIAFDWLFLEILDQSFGCFPAIPRKKTEKKRLNLKLNFRHQKPKRSTYTDFEVKGIFYQTKRLLLSTQAFYKSLAYHADTSNDALLLGRACSS